MKRPSTPSPDEDSAPAARPAVPDMLTGAELRTKKLLFYPKTPEEAAFVQERLFASGLRWCDGRGSPHYLKECVDHGIVTIDGKIFHRGSTSPSDYTLCDIARLGGTPPPPLPTMHDLFSQLAAKVDALAARVETLGAKVDRLHDEMYPTPEKTKPALKPPGGAP